MNDLNSLPEGLAAPVDDGAADHLVGLQLPSIPLLSTRGRLVDLSVPVPSRTIVYCYPKTGVPGRPLPAGWDAIPGARGCTPQACSFRDHQNELAVRGAAVFGLSSQDAAYQAEMAARLHLPFEVLSDCNLAFAMALRLPIFPFEGERLLRRLTMVIRDGAIEKVFYPVFPPDRNAAEVIAWLDQVSAAQSPG